MAQARSTTAWRARVLLACAVVGWSLPATAQTFYKWTDDKGVVHFSDSAPARTQNVEERTLRVGPVVTQPVEPGAEAGTTAAVTSTKADQPAGAAKPDEGPAKVIVVAHKSPRTGPSTMRVTGEVKNVGGANAKAVAVTITALDSTQGTSCLEEEAEVSPGTLGPGETGNFDIRLDSPCLFDRNDVDLQPVWE